MEFIISGLLAIQSILIIIASIFVLQHVLNICSTELRLAFIALPIGASLEFIDIFITKEFHTSEIILNFAILLILKWLWCQRDMIHDLEKMMPKNSKKRYSFVSELKAIFSCFGIWLIKKSNKDEALLCEVCKRIV